MRSLQSFLFWRAITLASMKNEQMREAGFEDEAKDPFTNQPVQIHFGRPDFEDIFSKILIARPVDHSVYACAPSRLCGAVSKICDNITVKTPYKFELFTEVFE